MGVATAIGGLAVVVVAGMGCHPPYDQTELKKVPPVLWSTCDPNGVTVRYVVEHQVIDYELLSVRVNDVDEACVGSTVRVEVDDAEGLLARGAAPVEAAGTVEVSWDEIRPEQVGSLDMYTYDVHPDAVVAVRVIIDD